MSNAVAAFATACLMFMSPTALSAEVELPVGSHPPALSFSHFPDRLHTFVWRNWQLVEPSRLAKILDTSTDRVVAMAKSMGLPPAQPIPAEYRSRAYITIIRRNWHLLPYDQMLQILDKTSEELAFSLHEDDFLFLKLGSLKPKCSPLRYAPPDAAARQRAAEIKRLVEQHFGGQLAEPGEERFRFVERLSHMDASRPLGPFDPARRNQGLRFIYSYFAPFGDPLLDSKTDPYPDGLLARLADSGVNGVWLHVVLRQLAPGGELFPEFGKGYEIRQANLRRLVQRAKRYGIGVYLYLNEPRAMPPAFFENRSDMAGISSRGLVTMCTSDERVRQWMKDSLSHLFRNVPDLAGVFTITASENPTNCSFAMGHAACPRCRDRSHAEIVAEVNSVIEAGVHAAVPDARVIVWDWGWNGHGDGRDIIKKLPKSVWLMSVSEWGKPIELGGVKSEVGEYSMSVVGPGARAQRHWTTARNLGLKTVAKMQVNNTWEMSVVPYVPVMDLVAEHCQNLAKESIDGQMLSWSLGGYPSPNLQVVKCFADKPDASIDSVLEEIAIKRYGSEGASHARRAWSAFSEAFRQFPFHMDVVYASPHQFGAANLLFPHPTGYKATMLGFPYDDITSWRGPFESKVFASQFRKVAEKWSKGVESMKQAVERTPTEQQSEALRDLRMAQTCWIHFASVANQSDFVLARDALAAIDLAPKARQELLQRTIRILDDEISLAKEQYALAKADSMIGFEASNHYLYMPLDLVEKVINCEWISNAIASSSSSR